MNVQIGKINNTWVFLPMLIFYLSSWVDYLPVMLSKASPSEELATLLMQKFLQVEWNRFGINDYHSPEDFFMAIIIYLFVSGYSIASNIQTLV